MILSIRKLACAVAKACVEADEAGARGPALAVGAGELGGLEWLSCSSRSVSRRCRPRGFPASASS